MANIKLKDLAVDSLSNSDGLIRDLSQDELALQGGRRHRPTPVLPPPEVSNNPTPFDPSFEGFSLVGFTLDVVNFRL